MSVNLKLVYGSRFICRAGGVDEVVLRNGVVQVTEKQAAYLLTLEEKDLSNNVHKKFVVTDELPSKENLSAMSERKRLAAEALKEKAEKEAGEATEEEAPKPKKRRAPRKPRAKKAETPSTEE